MTAPTYVPAEVAPLDPYVQAGVFGATEVHALTTYVTAARASGSDPHPDVLLALALAVRAPLHGHVCADLFEVADTVVTSDQSEAESEDGAVAAASGAEMTTGSIDEPGERAGALDWPEPNAWLAAVAASPLVRNLDAGAPTRDDGPLVPFVLEHGRVYLARFWVLERYVAADLRHRSRLADEDIVDGAANAGRSGWDEAMAVARSTALELFPDSADTDASQRDAVLAALDRDFVVVAGGPGTGKTHTVARLLAAVMSGLESVDADLQVALVAPTGKASARMSEAIRQSIESASDGTAMPVSDTVRARLAGLEATTIHRLLGRDPEGGFRHGPEQPLPHDIVVVDEVSMVSLSLIAHLLAAVRPSAKVVLVGDPYQLASVEAGAVLGDIVGLAQPAAAEPAASSRVASESSGGSTSGIRSSIRELAVVHRQGEDSPIRTLAEAIRDNRPDEVIDLLRAAPEGLVWVDPSDDADRTRIQQQVEVHARDVVAAASAAAAITDVAERADAATRVLEQLNGLKVLAALRRGRDGVDGWNRRIDQRLRAESGIGYSDWYTGRPVMVTRNDYVNHVFNGDVGVALAVEDRFQVWFPRSPEPLAIEATRLADIVTQWAMSIHKSQGSEFAHVVVALPPPPSRILTRELLYTAVTRAKATVTIMASEESIREAIGRPVARASGLAVRLAAE